MVDSFDFSDNDGDFSRNKQSAKGVGKNFDGSSENSRDHQQRERDYRDHKGQRDYNGSYVRRDYIKPFENSPFKNRSFENSPFENRKFDKFSNRPLYNSNAYKKPQIPYKLSNPITMTTAFKAPMATYRRPFVQRSLYTRNYKEQAQAEKKPLPKFNQGGGGGVEIQGYRDPNKSRYYDGGRIQKPLLHRHITRTFSNPCTPTASNNDNHQKHNTSEQTRISSPISNDQHELIYLQSIDTSPKSKDIDNDQVSFNFKIRFIDSYREFCKIKMRSSVNLESKYESISFLKSLSLDQLDIFLFLDRRERVFYGAAVVSLDELADREEIDTYALEAMVLRLNWIFLSEVQESDLNLYVQDHEHEIDRQTGLTLLKMMEQAETQLHDVKKIRPVMLKVKASRLDELEEFFRLTEGIEPIQSNNEPVDMDCWQPPPDDNVTISFTDIMSIAQAATDTEDIPVVSDVQVSDDLVDSVDSDDDFFADYE